MEGQKFFMEGKENRFTETIDGEITRNHA